MKKLKTVCYLRGNSTEMHNAIKASQINENTLNIKVASTNERYDYHYDMIYKHKNILLQN